MENPLAIGSNNGRNQMNWSIVLVFILLAGCTPKPVSKKPAVQIEVAPSETAHLPVQPRKLSKGEVLYIRYCADCHGWEGRGNGPAAEFMRVQTPVLQHSEILAEKSEGQFVDSVLYGPALKVPFANNVGPQTDSEVTALLAHIRRLPTIDWDNTDAGLEVYDELCVSCHGLYGRGDGNWASQMPVPLPDLSASNFQNERSDEELLQIIATGKNAMPGTEDVLNPEQIKAVVKFVRLLSPGYESYDRYCAACHGSDGFPAQFVIFDEEKNIGYERTNIAAFDDAYLKSHTDNQLRPRVQHLLENTSATMPHFAGDLNPDQVRQIFRYLNSLIAEQS